jgi:hypothetical protein
MPVPLMVTFVGGRHGGWHVERLQAVVGEGLEQVVQVSMVEAPATLPSGVSGNSKLPSAR